MKKSLFLFILVFLLAGCASSPESAEIVAQPPKETMETVPILAAKAEVSLLAFFLEIVI